jgi:hypothetical protein
LRLATDIVSLAAPITGIGGRDSSIGSAIEPVSVTGHLLFIGLTYHATRTGERKKDFVQGRLPDREVLGCQAFTLEGTQHVDQNEWALVGGQANSEAVALGVVRDKA